MKLPRNFFMWILAILIVMLTFVMIFLLFVKQVIPENKELVYTVFGIMLGWGTTIINYIWGSSKSSSDKTEMMNGTRNQEPGT